MALTARVEGVVAGATSKESKCLGSPTVTERSSTMRSVLEALAFLREEGRPEASGPAAGVVGGGDDAAAAAVEGVLRRHSAVTGRGGHWE